MENNIIIRHAANEKNQVDVVRTRTYVFPSFISKLGRSALRLIYIYIYIPIECLNKCGKIANVSPFLSASRHAQRLSAPVAPTPTTTTAAAVVGTLGLKATPIEPGGGATAK